MPSTLVAVAVFLLAFGMAQRVGAQTPSYHRDVPEKLAAEAKVSEASAISTAKHTVPNGKPRSLELEREKGKLIYSIDLAVPGVDGVTEVEIDAMDGSVIGTEHETAAKEKEETAAEKKEAAPRH